MNLRQPVAPGSDVVVAASDAFVAKQLRHTSKATPHACCVVLCCVVWRCVDGLRRRRRPPHTVAPPRCRDPPLNFKPSSPYKFKIHTQKFKIHSLLKIIILEVDLDISGVALDFQWADLEIMGVDLEHLGVDLESLVVDLEFVVVDEGQ